MKLNQHTIDLCGRMVAAAARLRIEVSHCPAGSRIIDCGLDAPGGLEAGRRMAEVCMAGLGDVSLTPLSGLARAMLGVAVRTDHPMVACLASQHAGWQVNVKKYAALGSGPMRAAASKEALFDAIGHQDAEPMVVGVLEGTQRPNSEVCEYLARECGITPPSLTLLVTSAASLAGTVLAASRTIETAMSKLLRLGFDLFRVESGFGLAPLPAVGQDDLATMGRAQDAILYGSEATLWVRGDDESLAAVGRELPSEASPEHGQPFLNVLARCDQDAQRAALALSGPAVVNLFNLDTGRSFRFGRMMPELLEAEMWNERKA